MLVPATTQHISIHPAKKYKTEGLQGFCSVFNLLARGLKKIFKTARFNHSRTSPTLILRGEWRIASNARLSIERATVSALGGGRCIVSGSCFCCQCPW